MEFTAIKRGFALKACGAGVARSKKNRWRKRNRSRRKMVSSEIRQKIINWSAGGLIMKIFISPVVLLPLSPTSLRLAMVASDAFDSFACWFPTFSSGSVSLPTVVPVSHISLPAPASVGISFLAPMLSPSGHVVRERA